jgi:uncharacterized protein YecE (DUF72 family)
VQAQLPPAFGPEGVEVLLSFMRRLPSDWSWAIELRHPGWFDGSDTQKRVDDLANERNITRVVLDTRPLYAAPPRSDAAIEERENKPRLPIATTAVGSYPIVRVIGQDDPQGTLVGLRAWVPQLVEWLREGKEPCLFVHQPENLDSPGLARQLYETVCVEVPELEALPEPVTVEEPEQTRLL